MSNSKRNILTVMALVLVAAITFWITSAWLTKVTEVKTNNFTFSSNSLNAKLVEPDWDGIKYYDEDGDPVFDLDGDDPIYGYEDGDPTKPVKDKTSPHAGTKPNRPGPYGEDEGINMIPGKSAPKDPTIVNTGAISNAWVAVKMTYVYGAESPKAGQPLDAGDLARLVSVIDIDYNCELSMPPMMLPEWDRISGDHETLTQVFYYRHLLPKAAVDGQYEEGGKTVPLFTTVKMKTSATNADVDFLASIGGFAIKLEGFAAQEEVAELNPPTVIDFYEAFKLWGTAGGVVFS